MIAEDGKIYAQVVNGTVHWIFTKDELPEWNNDLCPAVDITNMSIKPSVGWKYDGTSFSQPQIISTPYIQSITMRQCRLNLLSRGLLDDVTSVIDTLGDSAKIEWEYASTVERTSQLSIMMMNFLQLDEEDVGNFFYEASQL